MSDDKSLEDKLKALVFSSIALKNSLVAVLNFIDETINSDELTSDEKIVILQQIFITSRDLFVVEADMAFWKLEVGEDQYG